MEQVKKWLSRWQNTDLVRPSLLKKEIAEAIREQSQLTVPEEQIQISHHTVYLKVKPVWKTEIFLRRRQILAAVRHKLGRRAPRLII